MWENIKVFEDEKEHVKKFIFEKPDIAIEAVLYRYPTYKERTVLCISTMCGCPMGCRFCGTGDYFVRTLKYEEIVSQVDYILGTQLDIHYSEIDKLQIMFMSMGEPLLVEKEMTKACYYLYGKYSKAALLFSTSGPNINYNWINQLSKDIPTIGLQFSVHESTNEARDNLIPFKNKLTLQEIAQKGNEWYLETGRKPFFNYCAHENNTSEDDVDRLLELFDPIIWEATVSVICERDNNSPEKRNDFQRNLAIDFSNKLLERCYNVRVFDPAGQDTIGGGCGMLRYYQEWVEQNPHAVKRSVGFGKEIKHIPIKVI